MNEHCVHSVLSSPATNLAPYELNFQLLVRGACLLAGNILIQIAFSSSYDPGTVYDFLLSYHHQMGWSE